MSDAECWKLNRMRQLEEENLRLLRENADLKARLWGQEGWISVKDRLPTNDNSMLCYMNDGFMMVAYHNGYWLNNQGPVGDEDDRITHWMPLPKTPTLDDPKPQGEE